MCDVCEFDVEDDVAYGALMKKSNTKVHYFCLLLSTNMPQLGSDNAGILGFRLNDIKHEVKNCRQRVCHYCKKPSASIKCKNCDIYFHLVCGLKNNCLNEFVGEFTSYCHQHHGMKHTIPHTSNEACYICFRAMGPYNPLTSITANCCPVRGWVHKRCIQEYALAAGYFVRCLWCKKEEFRNQLRVGGVFVPDRDALWELEKGAFAEIYQKYSKCDLTNCLCKNGREFHDSKDWKIFVCGSCGSSGAHKRCLEVPLHDNFQCEICKHILNTTAALQDSHNRTVYLRSGSQSTADVERQLHMSKSQRSLFETDFREKYASFNRANEPGESNDFKFVPSPPPLYEEKTRLFKPDYSKTKAYIIIDQNDDSTFEMVLENAQGEVLKRGRTSNKPDKKLTFDEDLINKLVEKHKRKANEKLLHYEAIVVSSSDDSSKDTDELFELMVAASIEVPKPINVKK